MFYFFVIVTLLLIIAVPPVNSSNKIDYIVPFKFKIREPCCCIYEEKDCVKTSFVDKYVNVLERDGNIVINVSRFEKHDALQSIEADSLRKAETIAELFITDHYPDGKIIPDREPVYINVTEESNGWIKIRTESEEDKNSRESIKCIDSREAAVIAADMRVYYQQYRNASTI